MKIKFLASILFFLSSPSFGGQLLPYHPQSVESYTAGTDVVEDKARFKIALVTQPRSVDKGVRIGGVVVCSDTACYKPVVPNYVDLRNTEKNDIVIVADFTIPFATITNIHFLDTAGGSKIEGSLRLKTPIKFEKGYHGNSLMVMLEKKGEGNNSIYIPNQSASTLISKDATTVYYIPSVTTVANLPNNVTLTLPTGSISQPHVFNVSIMDVGNPFPLVDIFPYIDLSLPASLEVTSSYANKLGISTSDEIATPSPSPASSKGNAINSSALSSGKINKAKINFKKTGVFESNYLKSESEKAGNTINKISALASSQECLALLNNPANIQVIQNATATNGVAYINWCENIAPYIIIVYVNLNDSRAKYKVTTQSEGGFVLKLKTITEFGPSIVSMNGFVWTGDEGTGNNQKGKANGYVNGSEFWVATNCTLGGICESYDSLKFVMDIAANTPPYQINFSLAAGRPTTPKGPVLGNKSYNRTISSSTSVVRDGVCATPGTENRWSAIGAADGKMVMVSSTSSGITSAAELCPIFQAFQINNALRMDGGPSTAISIEGIVKNPLTGLAQIKYGSLRRIAYPVQITR